MIIVTDDTAFAANCVPGAKSWKRLEPADLQPSLSRLIGALTGSGAPLFAAEAESGHWDCLVAVGRARDSQYDVLSRLAVAGHGPDGRILCCAGSGDAFHGFKNRAWQACRGNIHLSAFIRPNKTVAGGAPGFVIAAALAALQTAVSFDLRGEGAGIKWVNDVLVGNAKVAGVLARLQKQGPVTEGAVLGIGFNVERRPQVERDPFVPAAGALSEFVSDPARCRHGDVFPRLAERLGENLDQLCEGGFDDLLELYRAHSLVIGRRVVVYRDARDGAPGVIARGRVAGIEPTLALRIDGHREAVSSGRVVIEG